MSTKMTQTERETFLADLHVGVISFPRPGKGPLTVPIWYDYEPGGKVWMITGKESLKGKYVQEGTRLSLCAQTEDAPYRYVAIEGPATISDVVDGDLLHMATRYLGEEQGAAYAAASEGGSGSGSIKVSITPDEWLTVDYSKR